MNLDHNFDIADRLFNSIEAVWNLASSDSTTDFKELIPEFFFLPEFLINSERLNLGVRQDGSSVNDVILPNWLSFFQFIIFCKSCSDIRVLFSSYIFRRFHGNFFF